MGMVPERFAGKYIADVQLYQRHVRAFDGIVQRHAGVGVCARIKHYASELPSRMQAACVVDGINQSAFVVALAKIKHPAVGIARLLA